MTSPIPKIIHQTWKTHDVPEPLRPFQQTWIEMNPDWEYRLWDDAELRALVVDHYPDFLPVYDGYRDPIMRVDAARYLLLHHFGGVYADLDFECLKPLDEWLADYRLLFGIEPPSHVEEEAVKRRGLNSIICNALIASEAGHPFWPFLLERLRQSAGEYETMDATGPFFITRALVAYGERDGLSVLSHEHIYPLDKYATWKPDWAERTDRLREEPAAYAVHHWFGSWWMHLDRDHRANYRAYLLIRGETVMECGVSSEEIRTRAFSAADELPLVSALMVTRDRSALARCAVDAFRAQSYPARELVILDDGADDGLRRYVESLDDPTIRFHRLPDEGTTLGELRNHSVELARGDYVCQWDDDDLSHPERLAIQMSLLLTLRADACLMLREQLWWPEKRRLGVSVQRYWEGSAIYAKAKLPRYPADRKGEDSVVTDRLVEEGTVVLLDKPHLYTYAFHGANTWEADHFEAHWRSATDIREGFAYQGLLYDMEQHLPIRQYLAALADREAP